MFSPNDGCVVLELVIILNVDAVPEGRPATGKGTEDLNHRRIVVSGGIVRLAKILKPYFVHEVPVNGSFLRRAREDGVEDLLSARDQIGVADAGIPDIAARVRVADRDSVVL